MMIDLEELRHHIDECCGNINESFLNIIDKNEMIQENCDKNSDLPEIFAEQLYMFCEYVSPDKDEITKWMDKKGYFYKGDKANKKKETMRMYQFLKQHKFDPKDETYESDIKETDGGYKRIKLNIDPSPDGIVSPALASAVKKGENSFYNPENNSINIGSVKLKNKQYVSQRILKHEEGHAASFDGTDYKNKHLPEDHPINKAVKDHKSKNKFANDHDCSSEELMADLYSVINTRLRTKHWGNNKTIRKISKSELISSYFHKTNGFDKYIEKVLSVKQKQLSYNDNGFVSGLYYIFDNLDMFGMTDVKEIIYNYINNLKMIFEHIDISKYKISTNVCVNTSILKDAQKDLTLLKNRISDHKKYLDEIKSVFIKYKISNLNDASKYYNDEIKSLYKFYIDENKTVGELIQLIDDQIKYLSKRESIDVNVIKQELNKLYNNRNALRINKAINECFDSYKKHKKVPKQNIVKLVGEIKAYMNDFRKDALNKDVLYKKLRETNELRISVSSMAIKEYFEELSEHGIMID